jgi:hypothetical protein
VSCVGVCWRLPRGVDLGEAASGQRREEGGPEAIAGTALVTLGAFRPWGLDAWTRGRAVLFFGLSTSGGGGALRGW